VLIQDLRCSPSRGVAKLRGTPYGIHALSDPGLADVRDARMPRVVHKDVWLAERQYGGEMRFRVTTYPLEVPVNYIAGVEVAETLSNIRQLVMGVSIERAQR